MDSLTAGLRELRGENRFGAESGRSLRDRQAAALAAFNPLEAKLRGGDLSVADQFAASFRELRDINREIFGSQSGFFEFVDRGNTLIDQTLASADSRASINSTSAPVVSAVENQTQMLINAFSIMNANQGNLLSDVRALLTSIDQKTTGAPLFREDTSFA